MLRVLNRYGQSPMGSAPEHTRLLFPPAASFLHAGNLGVPSTLAMQRRVRYSGNSSEGTLNQRGTWPFIQLVGWSLQVFLPAR
jgi:hypothetical protein